MRYYIATKNNDGCGDYGCRGVTEKWIIAANSLEEARALFPPDESWDNKTSLREFDLPDLRRKKKAFIYA